MPATSLATTWWGKSWNSNLERYADYSNRIGRGRSYVRHRAVLDLQLTPGSVTALVQGSQAQPYRVAITVDTLSADNWSTIRTACAGCFDSLSELLAGTFPQALKDLFFAKGAGLFPSPREIHFDCSCPDWASMCKHVAAALYGVGARFDEDPSLFFTLRGITIDDIITQTVTDTTQTLLRKAERQRPTCWTMSTWAMCSAFSSMTSKRLARPYLPCSRNRPPGRKHAAQHPEDACPKRPARRVCQPPAAGSATPQHAAAQRGGATDRSRPVACATRSPGTMLEALVKALGNTRRGKSLEQLQAGWDGRGYSSATPSVGPAPKGSWNWSLPASIGRKCEVSFLPSDRRPHLMGDL